LCAQPTLCIAPTNQCRNPTFCHAPSVDCGATFECPLGSIQCPGGSCEFGSACGGGSCAGGSLLTFDPRRIATIEQLKAELRLTLERVEQVEAHLIEAQTPTSIEEIDGALSKLQVEIERLGRRRKELEK
jgi:hypothetical protein